MTEHKLISNIGMGVRYLCYTSLEISRREPGAKLHFKIALGSQGFGMNQGNSK